MPQATNQRLVSQMAASPTGQGTVYNALLKARAVNRERAAVVNSCEKHRLEKVKRHDNYNKRTLVIRDGIK